MPDEFRMMDIASFFGVSIEYLRRDNNSLHAVKHNGALRTASRDAMAGKEEDEPLRVEVERIPSTHPSFFMAQTWREVTITIERKH